MENQKTRSQIGNTESPLRQQILQCADALENGEDVHGVLHDLITIFARSSLGRAATNCGSVRMEAVPFGDMLVIRALDSEGNVINAIDMAYDTKQNWFIAKPSISEGGM